MVDATDLGRTPLAEHAIETTWNATIIVHIRKVIKNETIRTKVQKKVRGTPFDSSCASLVVLVTKKDMTTKFLS